MAFPTAEQIGLGEPSLQPLDRVVIDPSTCPVPTQHCNEKPIVLIDVLRKKIQHFARSFISLNKPHGLLRGSTPRRSIGRYRVLSSPGAAVSDHR